MDPTSPRYPIKLEMCNNQRLQDPPTYMLHDSEVASSNWEEYYMELDALGRYFLSNLPCSGESIQHEWPKLTRALQQMTREAFFEFCRDISEEISRRHNDLRDGMFFLPPYDNMSLGRNHTRQKLASISERRFHTLCLRVCFEIGRRCARRTSNRRKSSLPPFNDPMTEASVESVERAAMLDNYHPHYSRSLYGDLSRILDNNHDEILEPAEYDFRRFVFPEISYDHFNATISAIYSVFVSILQDKEQYANLLRYRGDTAQQLLDLIQMLLDYPQAGVGAKNNLLAALSRLCGKSGLHPRCFVLTGIKRGESQATSGAFADIWKGEFQGQPVCLKIVRMYQSSNRERWLTDFSREAILWGHVSHANLLPFYGIYHLEDHDGRLCLVSPWMDNGNITEYLTQTPSAHRILLVSDIAAGLHYLHQRDIVHGDLKGANILVTDSGRACLSDFGLSTALGTSVLPHGSSSSSAGLGGTIRWQSPELLNPQEEYPRASIESDVYAFACVLYEIYIGLAPFYEYARDVTVIFQVMKGRKPSKPSPRSISFHEWGLSETLWKTMEDCWNENPKQRPTMSHVISKHRLRDINDPRLMNNWEEQSASRFRNAIYRSDRLSISVLETVLSWDISAWNQVPHDSVKSLPKSGLPLSRHPLDFENRTLVSYLSAMYKGDAGNSTLTLPIKMQFTLLTTVLVACMTVFVSASPVPAPVQVEARGRPFLPREAAVEVAREAEAEPAPICGKYLCL
ncbi:hypothetical protein GALMADRAFT_143032 [Galerina marginata CBS 339.88]|uniref:Protein kinase domain-containing protein n=1 Tax=Galerina marginata (strain CBS 339.88) TaxID=685588 RepID=A0A067SRS4_GALM3|nr:hypothetical protein GALMADRAFT_143032 [Galerina marginata CBS 339.88]